MTNTAGFQYLALRPLLAELGSYSRVVDDAGRVTSAIEDKDHYHLTDSLRYIISSIPPPGLARAREPVTVLRT